MPTMPPQQAIIQSELDTGRLAAGLLTLEDCELDPFADYIVAALRGKAPFFPADEAPYTLAHDQSPEE